MENSVIFERISNLKNMIDSLHASIITDKPYEVLIKQYKEYINQKKSLKSSLITTSGLAFDERLYEENGEEIELLQDILSGNGLPLESEIQSKLRFKFIDDKFNQERQKKLGKYIDPENPKKFFREFFMDLEPEELEEYESLDFSGDLTFEEKNELARSISPLIHLDYVNGLYNCSILIARIGSLPENLSDFLKEVKDCYALNNYLAVCALCRTILEISMRDLYNLEGFNDTKSQEHAIAENYFRKRKKGNK